MHVIEVTNVNQALAVGLRYLDKYGIEETSRNGAVLVAPGPVTTVYSKPWQRVLFSPLRNANPFFHLMEALWMLAGRDDLAWPVYFNKNFASYSDNGVTVHGAYGKRWRSWFGYDQLAVIAEELKRNPQSRRCVLTMWDAMQEISCANDHGIPGAEIKSDLDTAIAGGKDVPCNTHVYFDARGGQLNMTVCCRSNDIWWGAYGANAVHFSVLQEIMAAWVGVPMGVYRQVSNNYHLYLSVVKRERLQSYALEAQENDMYTKGFSSALLVPHGSDITGWFNNLRQFIHKPEDLNFLTVPFFLNTAVPMYKAWKERKDKVGTGAGWIRRITHSIDWWQACADWVARRENEKEMSRENMENEGGLGVAK